MYLLWDWNCVVVIIDSMLISIIMVISLIKLNFELKWLLWSDVMLCCMDCWGLFSSCLK